MRAPFLAGFVVAGLLGGLGGRSLVAATAAPAAPPATPRANDAAPRAAATAPSARVDPNATVITVNDFCAGHSRRDDACQTFITRAQFEALAEALQPGMPLPLRIKVAAAYARMLKMAAVAEQRGLDRTPAFDLEVRYARLQLLSQDLSRTLKDEAGQVSDADIATYYEQNRASYQQATLARIFVPRAKRAGAPDEQAMSALAADLRVRAVRGEDPDTLQSAANAAAGIPGAPSTTLEKVRATTLPPSHAMVLQLQPGDVSEVVSDPGGAHFIYKMLATTTLTLAEVTPEIHAQLAARRYRELTANFDGGVVFNDAYFSAPTAPTAPDAGNAPGTSSAPATPIHHRDPSHQE